MANNRNTQNAGRAALIAAGHIRPDPLAERIAKITRRDSKPVVRRTDLTNPVFKRKG